MQVEAQHIFSKRLKQARKQRGWSMKALREAAHEVVSVAALSKYEKGLNLPTSRVLIELAKALEVNVEFLFRNYDVELERIKFRKLTRLPKGKLDQITEQARDFFEKYFQIEELVGAQKSFKPFFDPNTSLQVDEMARELRNHWDIGSNPIGNVHALLEEHGVKVYLSRIKHDAFSGFSADTSRGPVAVVSREMSIARQRMTALHELAHIMVEPLGLDDDIEESFVQKLPTALLLPKEVIESALGKKRTNIPIGELFELKKRYGVAMSAIIMRAAELKIITEQTKVNFFRFGQGKKWRKAKSEPGDDVLAQTFPEKSNRYNRLVYRAFGEELITLTQAAEYLECNVEDAQLRLLNPF